jgi:uncharacterized protein (TIGR02145 family)
VTINEIFKHLNFENMKKISIYSFIAIWLLTVLLVACGDKTNKKAESTSQSSDFQPKIEKPIVNYITDIDGNKYKIVTIGEQTWMAENLNVKHFRNGVEIPNVIDGKIWDDLGDFSGEKAAWCSAENNIENEKDYGRLYNGFAILDPRGLAPEGWRIPTDEDWSKLAMFLGGSDVAGSKMRESNGFNAQFAGYRYFGNFESFGEIGEWCSSLRDNFTLWCRAVDSEQSKLKRTNADCYMTGGFSVRCIKNNYI